jgi:hypothetical protein
MSPKWVDTSTPIFPVATATLNCDPNSGGTPCDIMGVKRNIRTPYVVSWNLNVQQAITSTTSLQVAYVGNHGTKLYSVRDINQADPVQSLANGCAQFDTACEQMGRPFNAQFPFLEFINMLENGYTSSYNGLQITATQRLWHGLNFLVGYTWAHSIDHASYNRAVQPQNSFAPNLERGSSDFDVRNRFTLALTVCTPIGKILLATSRRMANQFDRDFARWHAVDSHRWFPERQRHEPDQRIRGPMESFWKPVALHAFAHRADSVF